MRQPSLVLFFATCVSVANGIGTMLVQGRADTIRTLKNMVLHSAIRKSQPELQSVSSSVDNYIPLLQIRKISNKFAANAKTRGRRHLNNVILESEQCDHVDLMDCSDFETPEMTCMITATGMTCCVCSGVLRAEKRHLNLFGTQST